MKVLELNHLAHGEKYRAINERVLSQPDFDKIWIYDISKGLNTVLEEE